jgi:hypothetical protein
MSLIQKEKASVIATGALLFRENYCSCNEGGDFMIIYEVVYNDGDNYEPFELSYGYFSVKDRAEELLRVIQRVDLRPDKFFIREHKVDVVEEWVRDYIAKNLMNPEEEDA